MIAHAEETYALRRNALVRELGDRGIEAHGASGMNVGVPVRDASAVVAGARFRLSAGPVRRITAAELEPADAARLASDFADCSVSPMPPTVGDPLRQARLRARSS
ncbi:hypothetical protein [Streptomyces sp. Root369]|uniref:hypothetical protein n=1 Tax=Streptomyces sp. Root369 TaxID=1736523 RepID=UPI001A8F588D|nr:hypothetical protein [Streptomyces sp. Root369]